MMTIDVAAAANDAITAISGAAYECLNNQSAMSRASGCPLSGGTPRSGVSPPVVDMAQHMLRNILQGVGRNKKDLYAFECELREAGNINNNDKSNCNKNNNNDEETDLEVDCDEGAPTLNNNDNDHINSNRDVSATKNNIDEIENEEDEMDDNTISLDPDNVTEPSCPESNNLKNHSKGALTNSNIENIGKADENQDQNHFLMSPHYKKYSDRSATEKGFSLAEIYHNNNIVKDDPEDEFKDSHPQKNEQKELKRARVENIVSCMRSSPLPVPVNGCKKRKLYHPQQHDNTLADYYAALDITETLSEDEDETACPIEMRKKVVEKNTLKNQLRTVQEQLAEMQQKYMQLCTQIEQDPIDMDEMSSDTDQEEDKQSIASLTKEERISPPPLLTARKDTCSPSEGPGQTSPLLALPKMLSSKLLSQSTLPSNLPQLNPHAFPLHPSFNTAALSFLQHQILQEQQHVAHNHLQSYRFPYHRSSMPGHSALNNVASMYLGASQKLALEQEARLAKEAILATTTEHQQQQLKLCHKSLTQSTHPQQSNSPHCQQPLTQNTSPSRETATKEPSSPIRLKNNNSPTVMANLPSSISSTLWQQQHLPMQPSTNTAPETITAIASPNPVSRNSRKSPNNALDLEGLADSLKTEITTTLSTLIDTIMSRFLQQKHSPNKISEAEQLNKDLLLASQLLDHKSSQTKVIDRCTNGPAITEKYIPPNNASQSSPSKNHLNSTSSDSSPKYNSSNTTASANINNNTSVPNVTTPGRSGFGSHLFAPSKIGSSSLSGAAAAAALYSSMTNSLSTSHLSPFYMAEMRSEAAAPEQNEALSLVIPQKKKRHKVTDTRITPRTVSRILAQDGVGCPPPPSLLDASKLALSATNGGNSGPHSPPSRSFHHLPHSAPMLPVSLPTSVAIPNPSLHDSQVFSSYSPFYSGQHQSQHLMPNSSPPHLSDHIRDSPPLPHHTSMFHPALLAAAQQQQQHQHQKQQQHHREQQQREQHSHHQRGSSSPDFMNLLPSCGPGGDSLGPGSECNSMDFDGLPPTSSTLSPMHLRKAKLMFFWVRYPTSAVLKMYFPDIRFNKNNTAQLVKWFSNFREFYYIQMEKYARAAIADGIKNTDDIHVSLDSDIYRVLNLHYNKNNHIEVPSNFRYVVEQTLKEFFKAIQMGKDQDQSWKKPIYKVIGRLDDPVPEYFKSPNFSEQLE